MLFSTFSFLFWFLPFTLIYALLDDWGVGMFLRRIVCLDQFTGNLYNFCWYVCCILLLYLLAADALAWAVSAIVRFVQKRKNKFVM